VPLTSFSDGGLYFGVSADTGHGNVLLVYQGGRQYDGLRSERSVPDDLYLLTELARDLTYLRYSTSIEIADSLGRCNSDGCISATVGTSGAHAGDHRPRRSVEQSR
jgi:hypothetical protein